MGSVIRMFARLLQLLTAVFKRRGQRRRQPKSTKRGPATLPEQQGSTPQPGPNRRARRQQQAEAVPGTATAKHIAPTSPQDGGAGFEPTPAPATDATDSRHRTVPFRVADLENFALTAQSAFEHKYNNVMLTVQGRVIKRLPTDTIGTPHQRFIIVLPDGQSILILHNIEDAPRVPFRIGDEVQVRGRYIWNEQGGEMHWTHHDPLGHVAGGYIELLRTQQRYE